MQEGLVIIQNNLLESYLKQLPSNLQQSFDDLHDAELSTSNLGLEYIELDYTQALPFLLMLPQVLV